MDKVWYTSKTIIASIVVTVLGVADLVGAIDVTPVLVLFGVPPDKAPGVVMVGTIAFGFLRSITSTGITLTRKNDQCSS